MNRENSKMLVVKLGSFNTLSKFIKNVLIKV